jgi:hypothetical protein
MKKVEKIDKIFDPERQERFLKCYELLKEIREFLLKEHKEGNFPFDDDKAKDFKDIFEIGFNFKEEKFIIYYKPNSEKSSK